MSKRRRKLRADVATFMRQYGRTSKRGGLDPNDRKYSKSVEKLVKRLPPDELDRILRDDEDDPEEEA